MVNDCVSLLIHEPNYEQAIHGVVFCCCCYYVVAAVYKEVTLKKCCFCTLENIHV